MTDAGAPVEYVAADRVATLTLDSPGNRNALSSAMVDGLLAAFDRAGRDGGVRTVVLTHTGTTFCAGADLREALAFGMQRSAARLAELLRAIVAHPKPVVAQVDGHVRAGGLGLLAACDLAVAGPAASFAFSEARLGLAPAVVSLVTSPRLTSRAASRYYLTGESFGAEEAASIGLITRAAADVAAATADLVDALRQCAPEGLAECKRLANAPILAGFEAREAELVALSARLFAGDEAREGMSAFAARRPPAWAGPAEPPSEPSFEPSSEPSS